MTGISDKVTFGKELVSYKVNEADQSVIVQFSDGTHIDGRLLVGADGVRSSVSKAMLPTHKYVDTGAMCIYGKTPITAELEDRFPVKGMRWMTSCIDEAPSIQSILIGKSPLTLLCEPIRFEAKGTTELELPADYMYWVLIGRKELFAATKADAASLRAPESTGQRSKDLSLKVTEEWDASVRSLIELQDVQQSATMRVVSALPTIKPWAPSAYTTVVSIDDMTVHKKHSLLTWVYRLETQSTPCPHVAVLVLIQL
jgi:hypothetical protein